MGREELSLVEEVANRNLEIRKYTSNCSPEQRRPQVSPLLVPQIPPQKGQHGSGGRQVDDGLQRGAIIPVGRLIERYVGYHSGKQRRRRMAYHHPQNCSGQSMCQANHRGTHLPFAAPFSISPALPLSVRDMRQRRKPASRQSPPRPLPWSGRPCHQFPRTYG